MASGAGLIPGGLSGRDPVEALGSIWIAATRANADTTSWQSSPVSSRSVARPSGSRMVRRPCTPSAASVISTANRSAGSSPCAGRSKCVRMSSWRPNVSMAAHLGGRLLCARNGCIERSPRAVAATSKAVAKQAAADPSPRMGTGLYLTPRRWRGVGREAGSGRVAVHPPSRGNWAGLYDPGHAKHRLGGLRHRGIPRHSGPSSSHEGCRAWPRDNILLVNGPELSAPQRDVGYFDEQKELRERAG